MKSVASGAEWVGFCGQYDGRGGACAVGEGKSWESGAGGRGVQAGEPDADRKVLDS